ncbi:MAG: hypothetical protein R3C44_21210 [Chloroflexota bacterium]
MTMAGLEFGPNAPSDNKTIEITGDNFTLKNNYMNVPDGASPYFGDERFNSGTNTSYIQSYTVDNNLFSPGSIVSVANGAGYTGPVSGIDHQQRVCDGPRSRLAEHQFQRQYHNGTLVCLSG